MKSCEETYTGDELKRRARDIGFADCRITTADPVSNDKLIRWLDEGHHGTMRYMARTPERRCDPSSLLPGAKSVICCALAYGEEGLRTSKSSRSVAHLSRSPSRQHDPADSEHAGLAAKGPPPPDNFDVASPVARFARGEDYHIVVRAKLDRLDRALRDMVPDAHTKCCVDTSPLMEKALAARAGIGWIGKNCLLINPAFGSWFVLGEIITDIQLPIDTPLEQRCGECRACIEACPTAALDGAALDARRCLSYLTLEHRGPLEPSLASFIDDRMYGCDRCQQCCPYNR